MEVLRTLRHSLASSRELVVSGGPFILLAVGKALVPLSHTDALYALRNHIEMVRSRLSR